MNRFSIPVCTHISFKVHALFPLVIMVMLLLFRAEPGLFAQANLVRAEYFFDTDPGFGKAINIPISPDKSIINKTFSADLSALPVGMHQLYIRLQDANGKWGLSNRTAIYKSNAPNSTLSADLVKAEYFIDTDPGFGNGINIPVTVGNTVLDKAFSANVDTFRVGIHHLYIRTKDVNGKWGLANRIIFYKAPVLPPGGLTKLIQVEYFIDTDPGFGKGVPLPILPDTAISAAPVSVNVTGLTNGTHRFFLRVKDGSGKWSVTNVSDFEVSEATPTPFITVTGMDKKIFCVGDSLTLGYHATGTYNTGNHFSAWLSNANGSFASEQLIGTFAGTGSGLINCKLPTQIESGTGFRIRVKSSNTIVVGDTTATIAIHNPGLGADTTVTLLCVGETANLLLLYNTASLTAVWNTGNPSSVGQGNYRLIVTNTQGCKDTAFVTVVLPTATWTGAVSTNWHTPGNWNNGKVPDASTHVFIQGTTPNICIISQNHAYASSVQLKNGGTLQQTNGMQLMMEGKCTLLPSP